MPENIISKILTYIAVCVGVAFLVTLIGPFGTFTSLSTGERLMYWLICIVVVGLQSLVVMLVLFNLPASQHWHHTLVMSVTAVITAFPATLQIHWLNQQMMASYNLPSLPVLFSYVLLLLLVIQLPLGQRNQMQFKKNVEEVVAIATEKAEPIDDFRKLLGVNTPGQLLCISAEDHYIKVTTDAASELILYRFNDAIKHLQAVEGLQVHRSWWVASSAIVDSERKSGKLLLRLSNGQQVPVSKTYKEAVTPLLKSL